MIELFLSSLVENSAPETWSPWIVNRETGEVRKTKEVKRVEEENPAAKYVNSRPWLKNTINVIRFIVSFLLSIVATQMAWACTKSVFMAILAFILPAPFILYYAMAGAKCAAYW